MTEHEWIKVDIGPGEQRRTTRCKRCGAEIWGTEYVRLLSNHRVLPVTNDCDFEVVKDVLET